MEIKFRGRKLHTDDFYYGDFVHSVPQSTFPGLIDANGFYVSAIHPETVAQLATHDDDDAEVYTGDEVHADNGEDYRVELRPVFVNLDGGEVLLNPPKHFKLKE